MQLSSLTTLFFFSFSSFFFLFSPFLFFLFLKNLFVLSFCSVFISSPFFSSFLSVLFFFLFTIFSRCFSFLFVLSFFSSHFRGVFSSFGLSISLLSFQLSELLKLVVTKKKKLKKTSNTTINLLETAWYQLTSFMNQPVAFPRSQRRNSFLWYKTTHKVVLNLLDINSRSTSSNPSP